VEDDEIKNYSKNPKDLFELKSRLVVVFRCIATCDRE
jgi:hypothetical protein